MGCCAGRTKIEFNDSEDKTLHKDEENSYVNNQQIKNQIYYSSKQTISKFNELFTSIITKGH